MAQFTRLHVLNIVHQQKLMPLFYHADKAVCKQAIVAAYKGGARLFEFTNRGDFAYELFSSLVQELSSEAPDLLIGVGSITDAATAALYIQAGAAFAVTPALKPEVIKLCNSRKVVCIPGCATLSEISQAEELGCEIVKLFPAELAGPAFIKAVRGPQPWTSIMPSGGVELTKESIQSWISAGAVCVGMGSNLFPKKAIEEKDWNLIQKNVELAFTYLG
jgi:2-dehydro-3-deoxyphosphogluconate aldolase/(4S)-4-hydroxy-2-oxoglutarate aldolase